MDGEWTMVALALLCGIVFFLLKWSGKKQNLERKLQTVRKKREADLKQAEQAVSIFKAEHPGLDLNPIVNLRLSELSQQIRDGSLQPDFVLHAYIEKALEVNSKFNCGTAFFKESLKQLEDIEIHKDGILYGIPVSIKENFDYQARQAGAVSLPSGSVADLWKQQSAIENYIHKVIEEWNNLELDVLICPILGPALNYTYSGRLTSGTSYTALYNLLNFPAGVIPITKVTAEDEDQLRRYKGTFGSYADKLFIKAVEGGVGLPLAVQCVSLPWQEELCLRLMRELEALCAKNKQSNTE
ncbi:fatty-acid amide hydrolase 1 isoform X1 [Tachysurus ichikawai]